MLQPRPIQRSGGLQPSGLGATEEGAKAGPASAPGSAALAGKIPLVLKWSLLHPEKWQFDNIF